MVNFRTMFGGGVLPSSLPRPLKFCVLALTVIATAIPSEAAEITQLSFTFAASQTINNQPLTFTVTPSDGWFSAINVGPNGDGVQFSFGESVPGPVLFADLDFIPPTGGTLPGTYPDASNYQFAAPGVPIFGFGFAGQEEDSAHESFTVLQYVRGPGGATQSFGATFEIFNAISGAVDVSGEADYNFDTSLPTPEPASIGLVLCGLLAPLCFTNPDLLKRISWPRF